MAGLPEPDREFPQFRLIVERSSYIRRGLEQQEVPLDRRSGARRRPSVLRHEKLTAPFKPT